MYIVLRQQGRVDFNSRAHVERDVTALPALVTPFIISTHALTWSATTVKAVHSCYAFISTHALTWSATSTSNGKTLDELNFNSRAHVERDIYLM